MKVAILSESIAEHAAIRIFVDAIRTEPVETHSPPFQSHGWTTVYGTLPAVLKQLHYNTDVDALAIVLDSDKSTPHLAEHLSDPESRGDCRLCQLQSIVDQISSQLKPTGRKPLQIAIGLAVPCLEAWLSCGRNPAVSEAAWIVALNENRFPYDCRQLKQELYGTNRPNAELESRRMREEATRLSDRLLRLEQSFKNGFGPFAEAVRNWKSN